MATSRLTSPVVIFAGALLFAAVSFAAPIALLTRTGPVEAEPSVPPAQAVATRTAAPAVPPVRVTRAGGNAERLETGGYRVTFTWLLEGARTGDAAVVRFSTGSRQTESRGALDSNVFTASTGELILATAQECSRDGWIAELASLRGQTPVGEAVARVAGVACP